MDIKNNNEFKQCIYNISKDFKGLYNIKVVDNVASIFMLDEAHIKLFQLEFVCNIPDCVYSVSFVEMYNILKPIYKDVVSLNYDGENNTLIFRTYDCREYSVSLYDEVDSLSMPEVEYPINDYKCHVDRVRWVCECSNKVHKLKSVELGYDGKVGERICFRKLNSDMVQYYWIQDENINSEFVISIEDDKLQGIDESVSVIYDSKELLGLLPKYLKEVTFSWGEDMPLTIKGCVDFLQSRIHVTSMLAPRIEV